MNHLLNYLEHNGILLCNQNPFLPALEDIGCSWNDVVELIDNHQLFYCKVFQKRTTYLSAECYYLLKNLRCPKPLTPSAERIYSFLLNKAPAETTFLKSISALSPKSYQQGFDFLLQNLYVTAFSNCQTLNPNWSSFRYCTSVTWENVFPNCYCMENAKERLWEILSHSMSEKLFCSLLR